MLATGARTSFVPVDAAGLVPEAVPADADLVFVTPGHQAPTGVTLAPARRAALLARAERQGFLVVEDDYDFEMSFDAPPAPALAALDASGRVLHVGSFSKSLFPGLRLGYLVAAPAIVEEARALRALLLRHPPAPLQRTVARFVTLGHYDVLVRRLRDVLAGRHATMTAALSREGLDLAAAAPGGGSAFWIEGPPELDADAFAAALLAEGVVVESGTPFFPEPRGPCRFFRMAVSSIPAARIPEGVRRTARLLRSFAGPAAQ